MREYFALIDDLMPYEEFERKVSALAPENPSEEEESAAARKLADDLGRLYPKIADLKRRPSLNCFYARVIECGDIIYSPKPGEKLSFPDFNSLEEYFEQHPLSEEAFPEISRSILVGDETCEGMLVFFNEKVMATREINVGDILEAAAKFRSFSSIRAADLRKCVPDACGTPEIILREGGMKSMKKCSLSGIILDIAVKEYSNPDGSEVPARSADLYFYDDNGFAEIILQNPPDNLRRGKAVIDGVVRRPSMFREYAGYEGYSAECTGGADLRSVPLPFVSGSKPDGDAAGKALYGVVADAGYVRVFRRRVPENQRAPETDDDAAPEYVYMRRCIAEDDNGAFSVVFWNQDASIPLFAGEEFILCSPQVREIPYHAADAAGNLPEYTCGRFSRFVRLDRSAGALRAEEPYAFPDGASAAAEEILEYGCGSVHLCGVVSALPDGLYLIPCGGACAQNGAEYPQKTQEMYLISLPESVSAEDFLRDCGGEVSMTGSLCGQVFKPEYAEIVTRNTADLMKYADSLLN